MPSLIIREAGLAEIDARAGELSSLLIDVVDSGGAVGFMAPLREPEAREYWREVSEAQSRIVLVALLDREIVGSVQLDLCDRPNSRHRAEILKLIVHGKARRQGIGRALMTAAERTALAQERTLLVLDTRSGDHGEALYRSLGYREAGVIPRYARNSDGSGFHATVIFYKDLLSAPKQA
jgi:ribosomal protein S18 acetylase RimI-like enzyme